MTDSYRTSHVPRCTLRTGIVLSLVLFVAAVLAAPGSNAQNLSAPLSDAQILLGDTESHTPSPNAEAIHAAVASRGMEVLIDQVDNSGLQFIAFRGDPADDSDATSADDFVVPEGVAWTIQEVFLDGTYAEIPNPNPLGSPECLAVDIGFWSDGDGIPGDQLFFYEEVAPASDDNADLTVPIPDTELASGTYWLSVQCSGNLGFEVGLRGFYWNRNDNAFPGSLGSSGASINPGGGLVFPEDGWNSLSDLSDVGDAYDFSFVLSGTSAPVIEMEVLVDQIDNLTERFIAFRSTPESPADATSADDFVVPEGVAWTIQEVFVDGSYLEIPNPHPNGPARCLAADLGFWSDADGLPGDPLYFYEEVAPTSDDSGDLTIPIEDTELPSGTYWFSVQCSGDLGEGPGIRGFYWNRNANVFPDTFGNPGAVINPGGGLDFPEDGWNPLTVFTDIGDANDFSFELSGTSAPTTANEDESLPGALLLKAAYPNPFTYLAVVEFDVPEPTAVQVAVYDVLGRKVAVLVDGPVSGGPHEARLDGTALSSGVYLIRMTTEDGATQTRRITLAR